MLAGRFCWLFALIFAGSGCYYLRWGLEEISVIGRSVSVGKLLEDPAFPDARKDKIRVVQKAKEFFSAKIGTPVSSNYSAYYPEETKYYVVSGCHKIYFRRYFWSFPIVGRLPYKSFLTEREAIDEARHLEQNDYDSMVTAVSGYSTLGYISDPIFPHMLEHSDKDLVELIFHELTHEHFYSSRDPTLSESLATFIASRLRAEYFNEPFNASGKPYMKSLYYLLDFAYRSKLSVDDKLDFKKRAFQAFGLEANNCILAQYMTYNSTESLEILWRACGGWKKFIDIIKEALKSESPASAIDAKLSQLKR